MLRASMVEGIVVHLFTWICFYEIDMSLIGKYVYNTYVPLKRDHFKGKSSSKLHFVSGYWDMLVFFVGSTMRHQNVTYKAVFPRAFLVITIGPINGLYFTRKSVELRAPSCNW